MADIETIKENLKGVDSTKIFFTDLNGRIMSLPINPENIEKIIKNGIGFDGSSIAGYASVENSDRLVFPDASSFRIVRFTNETVGFFIGNIYNEIGKRAHEDPRAVLQKVLDDAEKAYGYRFMIGPEHEFFLLVDNDSDRPVHSDKAGYFLSTPQDKGDIVRNKIIKILKTCGIQFEKAHHEVTPSQHEINLEAVDPLLGADRTILFNHITRQTASEFGYLASFMAKPFDGYNRNAFHIHISMQDTDGKNLFYDEGNEFNISHLTRQFIGGILKHARETSLVMASTYNSYKAYVIEREAPISRGWGYANRSSMVRIPFIDSPQNTRLELRNPDPAGNIYLQVAVLIAMGLRGIRDGLDCGETDSGSTYEKDYRMQVWNRRFLPKSMFEALVEAEKSAFLKEVLGERIYENYMSLKIAQWEEHRTHVTALEHQKYLSI